MPVGFCCVGAVNKVGKIKTTKFSFPYSTPQDRYRVWEHTEWIRKYYCVQGVQRGRHWFTRVTYETGSMIGSWYETYNIYFRNPQHATHFALACI